VKQCKYFLPIKSIFFGKVYKNKFLKLFMALPYFFSTIDSGIVVMGALFLIFFAFLNYVLSKVFRDKYGNVNMATTGIISFCISVLIVYFGAPTISNIIDGLQLSNTVWYIICAVAVLILLYLFRKKLRFCMILMLAGAGLILIGAFTEWFYQKAFVIIVGVILLLLGIWMCTKKKSSRSIGEGDDSGGRAQEKKTMKRIAASGRRAQEKKTMKRIAASGRRAQEKK